MGILETRQQRLNSKEVAGAYERIGTSEERAEFDRGEYLLLEQFASSNGKKLSPLFLFCNLYGGTCLGNRPPRTPDDYQPALAP